MICLSELFQLTGEDPFFFIFFSSGRVSAQRGKAHKPAAPRSASATHLRRAREVIAEATFQPDARGNAKAGNRGFCRNRMWSRGEAGEARQAHRLTKDRRKAYILDASRPQTSIYCKAWQ